MSGSGAVQDPDTGLPRNSSIDSAISAISSKAPSQSGSADGLPSNSDIASLVKKAGSAEALIQSLLKDKSQLSSQNDQLWKLVDKQRAMVLGLNKDLERACKDKERYRNKLKDMMADPAVSKAAGAEMGRKDSQTLSGPALPQVDTESAAARAVLPPDSPTLEAESQKHSPIDGVLAPYPLTPPSDGLSAKISAALQPEPAETMPKPQEHAFGKYDHEAEDRAADEARKEKSEPSPSALHFNTSLPPSRGLPPDPPKGPPPKPPTRAPPSVSVVEATPRTDEGFSSFPAPPRKAPPAPLQLQPNSPDNAIDDDTDSDLDDILDVAELGHKRGRRRTRAEDDRDREVRAWKEAEARSASKKSAAGSKPDSPAEALPPAGLRAVPQAGQPEIGTASLDAVLQGEEQRRDVIAPPLMSPGLPLSPRPHNAKPPPLHSPPLSPRTMGSFPSAPLSPRPPRQPIPLPPNTPLATPAAGSGDAMSTKPQPQYSAPAPIAEDAAESRKSKESTTDRTRIYKGLVTEEFPELLLPPNALPSIAIQVASSRMKPSRASLISLTQLDEDPVFTLAVISRSDGGELWRTEKDSASLGKLDSRLKQCHAFTATTPDRSLFTGHAPARVDARRVALEQYMDEVVNTPFDIATALELCKYLSTNTLPPNTDEMGASAGGNGEGSSHMIGPDGRPIRSGYLTKRGKNFGGWKSRFFLLDGPLLKYYETPGGAHLGTIKLQNAQIGKQSQSQDKESPTQTNNGEEMDTQYRHAFLVLEPKKRDASSHVKHVLCAENDRERDLWVDALLQWIDYRDPEDEEPSKSGGHAKGSSGRSGKVKKSNAQAKSNHQAADSDTLVGVRYDAVQAGDAPQHTTSRPKTSAGSGDHHPTFGADTMSSQPKIISGPKDPQPISDTAAWGNKTGLAAPSHEEKKARKRSFFGFGPKTRSNSDGQDSIPGIGELSSATPPPAQNGPVRQVFGAQLAEAVRYNPPRDVHVPLPSVVYRSIQYLDSKDATEEEGIFRLSGSNVVIKQLRERFNTEGDVNLVTDEQYYDIHAVASLLKLYLRELPTTILTRDLHMEFLQTMEIQDRGQKLASLNELALRLPLPNATLLKYLIAFLIKIINNSDMNKMTVRNVGIVFSPTLNIPAPVFAMFLQNYEPIFGIAPEEYQLPTPGSESGQSESQAQFEAPPVRPSTSSGASSPHRQPRIDSMRDYQRSTPTPPLMSNLNPARGTPTPPLGQQRGGYEPSYYPQQHVPSQASQRAPYDHSYGPPVQGHPQQEAYNVYPSGQQQQGYDRGQYQPQYDERSSSLGVQDQAPGSSNRRNRESTMFMGQMGLQHQGSRNRLRDQARY